MKWAYGISCAAHVAAFVAAAGLGWRAPRVVGGGADHTQATLVELVSPATLLPMAMGATNVGASGTPAPTAEASPPAAPEPTRHARRRPVPRPKRPILTAAVPTSAAAAVTGPDREPAPPAGERPSPFLPALSAAPAAKTGVVVAATVGPGGQGAGGGGGHGGQGRARRAPLIHPSIANYLRIDQRFPSLPEKLSRRGAVYLAEAEICVTTAGKVDAVAITRSAHPELDAALIRAIREWRYRPRMVDGAPSAFCHLMRFDYRKE